MIAENDVLFVVDGDNIFRSVQSRYGKDKRVSYIKLIEVLKKGRSDTLHYHMAIFVTLKSGLNSQMGFITRLSEIGFDIHTFLSEFDPETGVVNRHDFTQEMIAYIRDFRCNGNYPKQLVVASAKGALADLYTCLTYFGVSIEVMYVGETISSKIQDVDKYTILGEDVLYKQETS
jgi:hypothetical protein